MPTQKPASEGRAERSIRVLLVDDHVILRQALGMALAQSGWCDVIGYAGDGREAVAMTVERHPDVVLMDMVMPGLNGVEATRQITRRAPGTKVLVVSAYSDDERVVDALRAGASGYLSKGADRDELVRAIRTVSSGNRYIASVDVEMAGVSDKLNPMEAAHLSEREREVLQLVAEGRSNRQIAEALVVSMKTVETHRANLMKKIAAESSADVVRFAVENRIAGFETLPLSDR